MENVGLFYGHLAHIFYAHLVYLRSFGIFYGHLLYVIFFPVFRFP
jgi:hypothetical protein